MFLIIYLFLMLYAPRIGNVGDMTIFTSLFLMVVAYTKGAVEPYNVRNIRVLLTVLFLGLLSYSVLIFCVNSYSELFFLTRFGRAFFQLLGCYALVRLYYCKYGENMANKLLEHLFWAVTIHAVIMVMMFVNVSFREFIFALIKADVYDFEARGFQEGSRITGLVGALDGLSVVQSFGVLIFPIIITQLKGIKSIIAGVSVLLILFSIFISARTGIVLLIIFMPILLIKTKRDIFKIVPTIGITFIILLFVVVFIAPSAEIQKKIEGQQDRFTRLSEEIKASGEGEKVGALGKLLSDYKDDWPKDIGIFVFGNVSSCRVPWYFIPADPGWILDVHGIGIIGSSMMLSFYIICLVSGFRCLRFNKYVGVILVLYTLEVFIMNSKGRFLMTRVGLTTSCVLLFLSVYCQTFGLEKEVEYQDCEFDAKGDWGLYNAKGDDIYTYH